MAREAAPRRRPSPAMAMRWALLVAMAAAAGAEDPYRYFTWNVTYGPISPLGTTQQGILINGQFPGPTIECVTNDNLIVNVFNYLDEPFLITWYIPSSSFSCSPMAANDSAHQFLTGNAMVGAGSSRGRTHGRTAWRAPTARSRPTAGTTPTSSRPRTRSAPSFTSLPSRSTAPPVASAPSTSASGPPSPSLTHRLQPTSPSSSATGTMPPEVMPSSSRALILARRSRSPMRCSSMACPPAPPSPATKVLLRVSNVGMKTTVNVRIQGHSLRLAEVEGMHPVQNIYDSLDVHAGQSVAFLVDLDQPAMDYAVVVSTRFNADGAPPLVAVGTLHYNGATARAPGLLPAPPPEDIEWSMNQARSFRWNLTASAARPNPQGSFHYGTIPTSRTLVFAGSGLVVVAGQRRYAVNGVSFVIPDTPLKLVDNYNIADVIEWDNVPARPDGRAPRQGTPVVRLNLHEFIEVVFQNTEDEVQSWHLDGYDFWVVGYGNGQWTENERPNYNLVDAQARHTVQVYPNGWSAILVSLDNQGMWNLRSANWDRQYLGQQLYLRVWTAEQSFSNEYSIPTNAILCGRAASLQHSSRVVVAVGEEQQL